MKQQTILHRSFVFATKTVFAIVAILGVTVAGAQETSSATEEPAKLRSPNNPLVSLDAAQKRRQPDRGPNPDAAVFPEEFRSIDGIGNNADNPTWGSAGIPFIRQTTVAYADGASAPAGADRPSARAVSNAVVAQIETPVSDRRASDFVWQWGQFLDHDLDLTPEVQPAESWDILIPTGDLWFDPNSTGEATMHLGRSLYEEVDGVRQQINAITAFIDGSNVYGSDAERAAALRAFDGQGHLKTSAGNLLPFNTDGLPNAAIGDPASAFLAGDFRANEQVGLTTMHTLFVREHNYWADQVREAFPELDGDQIYEQAKAIVTAELQAITYREFLPVLLGQNALPRYRGYRPQVDPGISNLFATAAYRFGHSMLSPQLLRLDADGNEIAEGHLSLASAFFNPDALITTGIEPIIRGLATQRAQQIDNMLVDEVRNFLFGAPGSAGFDLASLNIQRGREHGLPSFNRVRRDLGMQPYRRFDQFHPDPEVAQRLRSVYDSVDDVDAWVGGLAEAHADGALLGRTWRAVLIDQFRRLRDGDRFWYESYLPQFLVDIVEDQSLARIIRRNTSIGSELSDNPFRVSPPND